MEDGTAKKFVSIFQGFQVLGVETISFMIRCTAEGPVYLVQNSLAMTSVGKFWCPNKSAPEL
jgi:hypothetical protein